MSLAFTPARLTGLVVFAVAGATALSMSACSSSHEEKSSAASSPTPAEAKTETLVIGMITSVSGNLVEVAAKDGPATVDISSSTKVIDFNAVQLPDVAGGDCVNAYSVSTPAAGGEFTAKTVQLIPQNDQGQCAQLEVTPQKVTGTVASVVGNTINVTVADANGHPASAAVKVGEVTNYTRGTLANSHAITGGKCLTAHGTNDSGGKLQATLVSVGVSQEGKCS